MPPRTSLFAPARSLALRSKGVAPQWHTARFAPVVRRGFADDSSNSKDDSKPEPKGPNTEPLPHVSEEARDMAKIQGKQSPEIEQGTPIDEVIRKDKEAQKHLPKVMRDSLKSSAPDGSRSFSTSAVARQEMQEPAQLEPVEETLPIEFPNDLGVQAFTNNRFVTPLNEHGLKFAPVPMPMPAENRLKSRKDPVVEFFTNMLMRHGEKATAERNMNFILNHLRTTAPPRVNPATPLLPGAPPPSHLPLNPALYLTLAVDSVAPLLRIKNLKGQAGGGQALQMPVALNQRQRRRTAIEWIITSASKKQSKGSGKFTFAQKVAEEVVSVVQGNSSCWERRLNFHKQGVAARANLAAGGRKGRQNRR
ncbi:30S ribosomal protein-like protein S7 [Phyllosticta citricarpa]|uniref:30S ribosomal protein-like protein S7 n=1 Tax=Phyllosticta paracitricarpa TaxID=2016321 RepID=A0ABR1NGJ6_9PEZI